MNLLEALAETIVERGDVIPDLVDYAHAAELGFTADALDGAVEERLNTKE